MAIMFAVLKVSFANPGFTILMFALLTVTLAVLVLSPVSASITCLKVGATATARWTNAADENCTWTGIVGSNFGIDPVNGGKWVQIFLEEKYSLLTLTVSSYSYACNGR